MKRLLPLLLLLPSTGLAIVKERDVIPGLQLRIEAQIQLTDKNGVAIPSQIIKAVVGRLAVIYRTDGFKYDVQITEIEESDEYLKVYGKALNTEDTNFGFVMAKGGSFAGAIVERKDNKTYVLEFSEAHKGFIFVRSYKHDKPSADYKVEKNENIPADWSSVEPLA
jgi:hypothetical protein